MRGQQGCDAANLEALLRSIQEAQLEGLQQLEQQHQAAICKLKHALLTACRTEMEDVDCPEGKVPTLLQEPLHTSPPLPPPPPFNSKVSFNDLDTVCESVPKDADRVGLAQATNTETALPYLEGSSNGSSGTCRSFSVYQNIKQRSIRSLNFGATSANAIYATLSRGGLRGVRDPAKVQSSSDHLLNVAGMAKKRNPSLRVRHRHGDSMTRLDGSRSERSLSPVSLKGCVGSAKFEFFCGLIIIANALSMGAEVHMQAVGMEVPTFLQIADVVTLFWYTLELILRLWALPFWPNRRWNCFDAFMVVACTVDVFAKMDSSLSNYSLMRFLRFLRVVRVLKVLRIGKTVNRYLLVFAKMTYCLQQSFPSLLSAAVVILIFTYASSIVLTQTVADHCAQPQVDENLDLQKHFGSLDKSFYSLTKASFNGHAWGELMQPLTSVGFFATAFFVLYLTVTLLCLMNVIHGVFVDSALQSTSYYKELRIAEAQQKRKMLMQHLRDVFMEIDTDGSGCISMQEFEACLGSEGGRAFFEVMGLSTIQAFELFRLMDADDSNTVDIDEFCNGCISFMGDATNFDMKYIIAENRQLLQKWTWFTETFESRIDACVTACMGKAAVSSHRDSTRDSTVTTHMSSKRDPSRDSPSMTASVGTTVDFDRIATPPWTNPLASFTQRRSL
mmetsp:Transcript_55028/g.128729  ORF Transcript_55028/g.128729 Transcript_55028/m.128729 type:complete len:673 (-) Transcript_55028:72-2090(-)